MKVGMNLYLWMTRLEPEHFPLLKALKQAGFDGVEIPMGDYSADEVAVIRQLLADEGLACTMATLLTDEVNPISPDPQIRQAAVDKICQEIDLCQALGAEVLVGPMHSAHKQFHGRGPTQQEFDLCVEFLKTCGSHAQQAGVKLAVEPLNRFECYFLNTAEQGKRLADAVDMESVGILYDTHHANIEENNVYDGIVGLGQRMNHFHVSESHRGTPGTGQVNWVDSFRAVKDSGFQGWLTIEAFGQDVEGIADAVNIWRNCYRSEEEVYQQGIALIKQYMA